METPNKPLIAAFDLDGTLGDIIPAICNMSSKITGLDVKPADWLTYDHYTNLGLTLNEFLAAHAEHQVLENIVIFEDTVRSINLLLEHGMETAIVTSRGFHPDAAEITQMTLDNHGLNINHVRFVGIEETKVEALRSLSRHGKVVAYIDDYLPHLHAINKAQMDIGLFLRDSPWNQNDESFTRLSSLTQYADLVIKNYCK